MHRFPSISTIRRIRLASLLVCLRCLLIPAFFVLLVKSVMDHDKQLTLIAVALLPAIGLLTLIELLYSSRTYCPLCMTPVLGHKTCNKHPRARRFLFNYKLRVALSALLRNSFRCPYCNEPSSLTLRKRGK